MRAFQIKENHYTPNQVKHYRKEIRSAYRKGTLSSEQIKQLRSAGFDFNIAGNSKPVVDLTTGEVYESMVAAAKRFNVASTTSICQAIEAKRLCKGHAFWWADDPNPPDVSNFRIPTGNSKPVVDLTTDEVYGSVSAAAAAIDLSGVTLRSAIEAKRLCKGHAFWWADDPNPPDVSEYRKPREQARPIIDLTAGEVFETMAAAAKSVGATSYSRIGNAIEHKRLYKGHAFWYADDPNPPDASEFREPTKKVRPIIDLATGEVFDSTADAAKTFNGITWTILRSAIEAKRLCKGHAFWWADDPNPPDITEFQKEAQRAKPVIDLTTGKTFESMVAAAKSVDIVSGGPIIRGIQDKRLVAEHAFWWADDPNPPALNEFRNRTNSPKPIIDLTTGEIFQTTVGAAKSINVENSASIIRAIEAKRLYKGHAFWYADDPNPPDICCYRKPKENQPKPVIDLTTGEVFETMTAASKTIGVRGATTVIQAIEAKRLCKGHAFWWADDPNPPAVSEFRGKLNTTRMSAK